MMETNAAEVIYQGNSIITVDTLPDYPHPVVIKRPVKPHASRLHTLSLEKEYEMTRHLDEVEGVRQAFEQQRIENQPVLILEHIDGETLRGYITRGTLSLRARLEIAVDLARILSGIHQQNVIHLDLNSTNILIGNKKQSVHIIDLGSAFHTDRTGQLKVRPDQLLGTLPYISPEQTGRINRTVDERSDLYSLGVVLYELMTQQLPFDSEDPLKLIHDHIARVPVSPSEVSSEIPEVLSAIILKLLSKNAEDRYQSAAGVQADLEKCLQRLSPEETIEAFPLGEADYSSRLRFPQELYGRDRELKLLERAFESVCRDSATIVLVSGYSGIGKTVLVEELQRPVSEKSGYFVWGKFDQLATIPYAGISQALARFVSQILTQTETQLAAWRSKLLEAVGPNGRVLTDVVPSLELVIGPQSAVPDLSGQEAQNRFNYVFQRFFGAIARSEHPICFFLDDLQWIDPASLDLLRALFSSPDLAQILIVGAYRDNEVHEAHPLMTFITDLEKAGANLRRMNLQELAEADIGALISDVLRREPSEIRELSRLVYSQTDGNPFFTRQVLRSFEDQGLIALDTASSQWRWDMDAIRDQDVLASVGELLVGKLKVLPADVQETLKVAACIGNQFDIATLTVVTAEDDDVILVHVQAAVAAGLIWERDDRGYFVHDRVQEAAYALVPLEDQDRLHLTIGRLLMQRDPASDDEQDIYRIVDQLNYGLHLVEDELERMQFARLNLQAARAAHQATAFETGLNYAQAGIEFLGENSWEQDYRLTLVLHEQAALLAHAGADMPAMKQHSEQVLQFGRDPLDLARVQRLHIEFLLSSNRFDEAVGYGLEALRILGQEFPPKPDWMFTIKKLSEFLERLEQEPPDYFSLPRLYDQDPELLAVSEILLPVGLAAFISRPALAPLIEIRSLELSLERQLLPEHTPWKIAMLGVIANSLLGKSELAYKYGETAVELAGRAAFPIYAPLHIHALYNHFRRKPLREALDLYDRALQSAHDYGNNEFVANVTQAWSNHAFYASIELAQVEERSVKLRTFLDAIQYENRSRWVNIQVTAAQALRGSSSARGTTWRGTPFDDDRDLSELQRVEDKFGLLFAYCAKAWVATLFGDHDGVKEYSDRSRSFLVADLSGLEKATLAFICGLRRARELRVTPESSESEQVLQEQLDLLERFAGLAPMNFAHKLSLVQAEVHRARGEVLPAMKAYEQASQGARENGYLNEAGLAHALAAEFYQDLGLQQAALHNLEQAALAWQSWGAHALVESLSHRFADLLEASGLSWQSSTDAVKVQTSITQPITPIQLDLESITSASQLLAAETNLDQLCTKMITLVMATSGAEKAVLLLKQENEWFVQAKGEITSEEFDILLNQPYDSVDSETHLIPDSVFRYCRRSEEVLVVGDAQLDQRFAQDRLVEKYNISSMACIPILSQGRLRAMLYLENRQMADVFNLESAGILKHLSAQFGVSVENALLYNSLNETVRELQTSDERYERAIAGSAAGIWDWDLNSDAVHYSDRFKEMLGFEPEDFSDSTDEFWGRIHPDDYMATQQAVDQHLEEQIPFRIDYRLQLKSGEYRWFHARGQSIWDKDGKAERMSGSLTDITERKLVEQMLVSSEALLISVLETSPDVIVTRDLDFRVTYFNEGFAEVVKKLWGVEAHVGMDTLLLHSPELKLYWEKIIAQVHEGEIHKEEFDWEYSKDETRHYELTMIPIVEEGKITGTAEFNHDRTHRKLAEKELTKSEERFRSLMESSPIAIAIFTTDGKISQVNSAWKKSWGLSDEETAQVLANYNMLTDKQLEDLGLAPLVERAFTGEPIILPPIEYEGNRAIEEMELEHIEARSRWIQTHLYSIKDANGEMDNVIAINMDITELKQAERVAQEQREALARMDRTTSMGQLTGSISHELNQPLTGILSNAQAAELMIESGEWEPGEMAEIMADISADTKRAGAVIHNLRQLYREQEVEYLPVNINAVVDETVQLLHSEFVIQRVELTKEYDVPISMVYGNRIQLQQVLVNLVMNANQAMNSTPREDRRLHIATSYDENEIKVWVDDKGTGIDPEKIDQIFEPLATWKPGHTGMGLAICNSIINAHGGRMWAENRNAGGARVGFAVPIFREGQLD